MKTKCYPYNKIIVSDWICMVGMDLPPISFEWSVTASVWCGCRLKGHTQTDQIRVDHENHYGAEWEDTCLQPIDLSVSSQRSTKDFPTVTGRRALALVSCFLFEDFQWRWRSLNDSRHLMLDLCYTQSPYIHFHSDTSLSRAVGERL